MEKIIKNVKAELIDMLNQALMLEHAARIQYLAHAEQISGLNSEAIIARLREIASDEAKHEEKFRTLIANYLGGIPCMDIAKTHVARDIKSILNTNLRDEKVAIDLYKKIHEKVLATKSKFPYEFEKLEHEIRHVILDEQEHVIELKNLIG